MTNYFSAVPLFGRFVNYFTFQPQIPAGILHPQYYQLFSTLCVFFLTKPEYVIHAAGKVGGIKANNTYRAEFIYDNNGFIIPNNSDNINTYFFGNYGSDYSSININLISKSDIKYVYDIEIIEPIIATPCLRRISPVPILHEPGIY